MSVIESKSYMVVNQPGGGKVTVRLRMIDTSGIDIDSINQRIFKGSGSKRNEE